MRRRRHLVVEALEIRDPHHCFRRHPRPPRRVFPQPLQIRQLPLQQLISFVNT